MPEMKSLLEPGKSSNPEAAIEIEQELNESRSPAKDVYLASFYALEQIIEGIDERPFKPWTPSATIAEGYLKRDGETVEAYDQTAAEVLRNSYQHYKENPSISVLTLANRTAEELTE